MHPSAASSKHNCSILRKGSSGTPTSLPVLAHLNTPKRHRQYERKPYLHRSILPSLSLAKKQARQPQRAATQEGRDTVPWVPEGQGTIGVPGRESVELSSAKIAGAPAPGRAATQSLRGEGGHAVDTEGPGYSWVPGPNTSVDEGYKGGCAVGTKGPGYSWVPGPNSLVDQGHNAVLDYAAVPVPVLAVLAGAGMLIPQVPMNCNPESPDCILASPPPPLEPHPCMSNLPCVGGRRTRMSLHTRPPPSSKTCSNSQQFSKVCTFARRRVHEGST